MMEATAEKKYYRPDELATLLCVTIRTVHRWIRERRIDHVHTPGGHLRIPSSEIAKVIRIDTK